MKSEDLLKEIGNVSQDLIADHALPEKAASEHAGRNAKKEIHMKFNQKSEYIKNPFVRILPGVAAVAAVVVAAVVIVPKLNLRGTQSPVPAASIEQDQSSSDPGVLGDMPDLTGMNVDEARLAYPDLDIVVSSREYSDYEQDFIIEQDVVPGSSVSKGNTVNVKVSLGSKSLGSQKVRLPDLKDWPYEMAKNEILRLGLFVDKRSAYDDTVPENNVISTDPAGPIDLDPGSYVRVTVSLGKSSDEAAVPNFVEMNYETAEITASGLGLQIDKKEVEDTAPEGIILSQNIQAGETVSTGTVIELTVSKGSTQEGGVRITFAIPADAKGSYHLNLMKDGLTEATTSPFEPENTAGFISVAVEGEGETDLIAVLVNDDTGAEETIGTWHVDFGAKTSQMMSGSIEEAFRKLSGTGAENP